MAGHQASALALSTARARGGSRWAHGASPWLWGVATTAAAALVPVTAWAEEARSNDGAAKRQAFTAWLAQQGARMDAVSIGPSTSGESADNGLFAAPGLRQRLKYGWLGGNRLGAWASGQRTVVVAEVPLPLAVTAAHAAADAQLGPALSELLELGAADERTAIMLFLMTERARGPHSRWAPWLDVLPESFTTPLWFTEQQLEDLRGTSLGRAAAIHRRRLTAIWERLRPAAADLCKQVGVQQEPSLQDFTWAYSVFWSRGQSLPITVSTGAAASSSGAAAGAAAAAGEPAGAAGAAAAAAANGGGAGAAGGSVRVEVQEGIVPGLDFANHQVQANCWWEVADASEAADGEPRMVRLMTNRACCPQPGQELFFSYGDKGNEELLMLYGFALPSNPHDAVMIACPLAPPEQWDNATRARLALLQSQGLRPQFFLTASHLEEVQRRSKQRKPAAAKAAAAKQASSSSAAASAPVTLEASCLPTAAWRTLEAFVIPTKDVARRLAAMEGEGGGEAAAAAGPDAGAGSSGGAAVLVDQLGISMAVLTTFVRLLELQLLQLEDEVEGTGPLERDLEALRAAAAGPKGAPAAPLPAWRQACIVYRSGQKQLVRGYLVAARAELQSTLNALQAAIEQEGRDMGDS